MEGNTREIGVTGFGDTSLKKRVEVAEGETVGQILERVLGSQWVGRELIVRNNIRKCMGGSFTPQLGVREGVDSRGREIGSLKYVPVKVDQKVGELSDRKEMYFSITPSQVAGDY